MTENGQTHAVIEARDVCKTYHVGRGPLRAGARLQALRDVSFTLGARSVLAVVGESGCGKSTLARQVMMIEQPTSGSLWLEGRPLSDASPHAVAAVRRRIQFIFQNPYGSLNPRKTIAQTLDEPLRINTELSRAERRERVLKAMSSVDLPSGFAERYPHMISGGQQQRVAIARALMLSPKVIVADEPVASLDVLVQVQVINLLMDLRDRFGLSYLFISHDLALVERIADEVVVMYLGAIVEQGSKARCFDAPLHPYTRALLSASPGLDKTRWRRVGLSGEIPSPLDPPSGCALHRRCPFSTSVCAAEAPPLRDIDGRQVACHHAA